LRPYTIQRHKFPGTDAERAGSSLALSSLLATIGAVITAAGALAFSARHADPRPVGMISVLAVAIPFLLLRDFARRHVLAQLRSSEALLLDVAVTTIQFTALGWLESVGLLSAVSACAALGVACGLTSLGWLYCGRRNFSIRLDRLPPTFKQSWDLGKWMLVIEFIAVVQSYATYWLSALLLGTTTTGVFAACMSVASIANPIFFGLMNILVPKEVLAFQETGHEGLRRHVISDAMLLGCVGALVCTAVLFAGENAIHLFYRGNDYLRQARTVTVLALALMAWAVGIPAYSALMIIERPRRAALASLVAPVLTVGLAWWLVQGWGLVGLAYAFLVGHAGGTAARWVALMGLPPSKVRT
jgi:O-antigen/teichoic acid export membrane protein